MSSTPSETHRASIEGAFNGFDGDTLFKLSDGTYWIQAEYKYWYHYEHRPQVEIFPLHGVPHLRVVGHSESVAVQQIGNVIESQIVGEFTGWDGESEYELTNGQVWKQERYRYQYQYKYRPHVTIYPAAGGTTMDVDGCRAVVGRVR